MAGIKRKTSNEWEAGNSLKKRKTDGSEREAVLTVDDLVEILDLLKRHGYSGTTYYDLGLFLGLLPGTLGVIKENNKGDVLSGLRECLMEWLKQADNVKSVGVPSYYSLIQALRKLGENAVADGIDEEKHPSCVILAPYKSDLSVQQLLPKIALFLYKEGITKGMVLPATPEALMDAVKESVCGDHSNLHKFADILKGITSTVSVGEAIDKEYRKIYQNEDMLVLTEGAIRLEIYMPQCFNAEFVKMRIKFGQTFCEVLEIMKTYPSAAEKLSKLLKFSYFHLKPRLTQCHDVSSILELVQENCSLNNISLLESIMSELDVKEAVAVINGYKKNIEEFFQSVSLRLSLDELFSSIPPLQCETATIYVGKNVNDCTLNDIEELISLAADRLSKMVSLVVVKVGNSFTITCSFPVLLSESLIATALDNIDSLIERGVEKLTIGYSTVYDHEKLFHDDEAATSKKYILTSEVKQELYASVYSSHGTMEQLLISRTIQLLNSEEELASVQQLKEKNEKLEAEMKVLSGMKWEVDQLRTREMENVEELKMLQEKISVQSVEILEKEDKQIQLQKSLEEKEMERKAELQKIDGLFYSVLQEKDTELQEVIQMQQVNDTQYLQAKRVFLEHFIELSVAMAVTPNRLSIVKKLYDSSLISETSLHKATEDDTVSGIESGIVLMDDLKAAINEKPDLISSLVAVLEGNEAFKSIAKRMGKGRPLGLSSFLTSASTITKSQPLDIYDLADILDLLKRHGYSGTDYYDLGLFLGLLPGTLNVIAKNHSGDVSSCLRECLKAWLLQADNVKSVGVPSYFSLIKALRKLGENAVADGIDREKHPACVIFTAQCESNESVVAALPSLAILLYKEKIIDEMSLPTTGEVLLKVVKRSICSDYHNLEKFAVILKESQNTSSVGQSLMDEYKRLFPADCALVSLGDKVILTIRNLIDIIRVLEKCHFQNKKWRKLGLYLGLIHTDLKTIETNYPQDAERCLEECLAKWLTDDIEATWEKLAIAVDEVGETSVAEYIKSRKVSL